MVVSVEEKVGRDPVRWGPRRRAQANRWWRVEKCKEVVETGWASLAREKSGGRPAYRPDGVRHKGGVTLVQVG